ncbi:MAG: hypothetical protein N2651_01195 [Fimbriimonadales bacterium]|nr:hypothetical protein [Fimbriimonadales bacterium]
MQKHRILSGVLVWLPVTVASLSVLVALSGCGGASSGLTTLPETQQQQLGGVVNMNNVFSQFNPNNDDLNPPQGQQQTNCPQYTQITQGVLELDYGTGCQPYPGAPTYSGKIIIAQDPTGANFEVNFQNYNSGGPYTLNGSIIYSQGSTNGSYTITMDLTQTPASGTLQTCSVQFQFSGTYTPNNNGGYTLNGQGTQTTTVGNNSISYQITYNNVSTSSGCNYPTSGTTTVQQLAPTGAPLGPPTTINYNTGQCGIVQVSSGGNTFTVNLANFNAPNPCQGAPRI